MRHEQPEIRGFQPAGAASLRRRAGRVLRWLFGPRPRRRARGPAPGIGVPTPAGTLRCGICDLPPDAGRDTPFVPGLQAGRSLDTAGYRRASRAA